MVLWLREEGLLGILILVIVLSDRGIVALVRILVLAHVHHVPVARLCILSLALFLLRLGYFLLLQLGLVWAFL